ncbi:MAG: LysM peptidoglycan-binding domain-containing M23 family metallopeptidase [Burkholderiales bacterium]|nr:LysM peptidoglycan-binding domain-containing M23 family metallopeptidase [Anaerolineae bacterium]
MSDQFHFDEPPISPDDTHPTQTFRAVSMDDALANANAARRNQASVPMWRRTMGLLSLLVAVGLTVATTVLLLTPPDAQPVPEPSPLPAFTEEPIVLPPTPTPLPTEIVQQDEQIEQVIPPLPDLQPTISVEQIGQILSQPPQAITVGNGIAVVRDLYNPFTLIPDRARSEVIEYEIVTGDTIYTLAERFGISPESIGWCNDRQLIMALRPGRTLNIPPVDGACQSAIGSRSIADYAADYFVDPYDIIDADFNGLFGASPDTVPPSGMFLVIPGGTAEQISWNPPVVRTGGDGSNGSSGAGTIAFAPGDPGSCGPQPNSGGVFWAPPLPAGAYTFMRGFDGTHSGVDLAASVGTTVYAANGGTVIFAGWSTWGYGYTVVLAHGPYTTLYGHLSSFSVSCGRTMYPGDPIGAVGTSGNSSGPHLHFEIRYLDSPTNPTATMGF